MVYPAFPLFVPICLTHRDSHGEIGPFDVPFPQFSVLSPEEEIVWSESFSLVCPPLRADRTADFG